MSFPVNKYARYKRATTFFLNWLLRVHGGCHIGQRMHLETFNQVVKTVATEPSNLPPNLLHQLPKALAACRYAIILRESVSTFFSDDHEAQQGHRHFLSLLQNWYNTLQDVQVQQQKICAESENFTHENYYDVLQTDEDYFDDEEMYVAENEALKSFKVKKKHLLEMTVANEMRMEAVCFFLELDELMESVFKVYVDVKKEKRTLVEATVVVKVAMDTASALTAQLQLKYPSLRTGEDMYNVIRNIDPDNFRHQMASIRTKYLTDLQDALRNGNGEVPYVRGMFVMDFMEVGTTLDSFLTAIPIDPTKSINFPHGCFGEVYGEDRTPQYVLLPDLSNKNVFLLQQLPLLHKAIVEKKVATGCGYDLSAPMGTFMVLMENYFTTREVTVPVIFACICWMKSVAALQGDAVLGRNMSIVFQHSTDLMRNIHDTLVKGTVQIVHKKSNDLLQLCAAEIERSTQQRYLSRANPLLAGLTMLDHHFKYLHMASEILLVTSRFRSFGHIYNALVKEGYLECIPVIENVLETYHEAIFTPSRNAAIHGSYYRTLLLSVDLRTSSVDALCRGETLPAGNEKFKKRKAFHLSDVSKTYRLMIQDDKSLLEGTSWTAILKGVADMCSAELFETRVLSRDLLKLNDDLVEVFSELCAELMKQGPYDHLIGKNRLQREKEDGVVMMLLQVLDELEETRSLHTSVTNDKVPVSYGIDNDVATKMCKTAAAVIRHKFITRTLVSDEKYFTFPSHPDFANQVYGSISSNVMTNNGNREQVFSKLMKMLKDSNGSLPKSDLSYLKRSIKDDPQLLGMMTSPSAMSSSSFPSFGNGDLCTLLHQAAAGPAHDAELVEWLIQMGALVRQPSQPLLRCREGSTNVDVTCRMNLPNVLAVHSAAIAGYANIVQIILEADNFVDLNTPTLHTKETLAHLAVKHGHRGLFRILVWYGADLRINDGQGRRVYAVTSDRGWSRDIVAYMVKVYRNISNDVGKSDEKFANTQRSTSPCNANSFKKRSNKMKTNPGKSSAVEKRLLSASTGVYTASEGKSHLPQCVHTSSLPSRRCY